MAQSILRAHSLVQIGLQGSYTFFLFFKESENSPQFAQIEASHKMHLASAFGFYQNLLLKFQADFYRPDVWSLTWKFIDLNMISGTFPMLTFIPFKLNLSHPSAYR